MVNEQPQINLANPLTFDLVKRYVPADAYNIKERFQRFLPVPESKPDPKKHLQFCQDLIGFMKDPLYDILDDVDTRYPADDDFFKRHIQGVAVSISGSQNVQDELLKKAKNVVYSEHCMPKWRSRRENKDQYVLDDIKSDIVNKMSLPELAEWVKAGAYKELSDFGVTDRFVYKLLALSLFDQKKQWLNQERTFNPSDRETTTTKSRLASILSDGTSTRHDYVLITKDMQRINKLLVDHFITPNCKQDDRRSEDLIALFQLEFASLEPISLPDREVIGSR